MRLGAAAARGSTARRLKKSSRTMKRTMKTMRKRRRKRKMIRLRRSRRNLTRSSTICGRSENEKWKWS
jgi:hypothetical protein